MITLILKIYFCTDGKISVRINLPLFFTVVPASKFMFLFCTPFAAITTFDNPQDILNNNNVNMVILQELYTQLNTTRASEIILLKYTCEWIRRINLPLFSTVVPAIIFVFLSCRPFVAITTLSTGLVGVEEEEYK